MAGATNAGTFGGRVRIARLEARRTSDSLARELGYTRPWVYAVESGRSTPDPDTVVRLGRVLSVSPGWLLAGEESGDSEFIARLRGAEVALSDGQKRGILALAAANLETNAADAERTALLTALLSDPEVQARGRALGLSAFASPAVPAESQEAPAASRRGRGRARAG